MPQQRPFDLVFALEHKLGGHWAQLHAAYERTQQLSAKFDSATNTFQDPDASIVACGSVGRFEVTDQSDIDWVLLIDGQANLSHQRRVMEIAHVVESLANKSVGPEGTFGKMAFSHDLVQYIGGGEDTNANFTRRMLLLLESKPIGHPGAYNAVLSVVLERYLKGDHGWIRGRSFRGVPRFLLNDIVRYWRTIAVDYAYKQWTRDNRGWSVKSAKLRLSRKLIYASGLVCCFGLAEHSWASDLEVSHEERKLKGIDCLLELFALTPLDRLAMAFERAAIPDEAKRFFDSYDEFLGILSDANMRERLDKLEAAESDNDDLWKRVRTLGEVFQNSLDALFFDDTANGYPALIKKYGVF